MESVWHKITRIAGSFEYHRFGRWAIPLLVAFPGLSRRIAEGLGGMFMPAISAIVPLAGSIKFIQKAGFRILGKWKVCSYTRM
jgi:hypothetical protein